MLNWLKKAISGGPGRSFYAEELGRMAKELADAVEKGGNDRGAMYLAKLMGRYQTNPLTDDQKRSYRAAVHDLKSSQRYYGEKVVSVITEW